MIQLSKADIGKKFITREGKVVEMIEWDDTTQYTALMSNEEWYTNKGTFWASGEEDRRDIISRVEEEPQPEKQPEDQSIRRIVINVMEKGIRTDVEGMNVLEAFGALNHVVRTFIEDKP